MTQPSNEDLARGRAYSGAGITVYYDARRCIHVANCVRGLPDVFKPKDRPWVQPEHAEAAAIAAVVRTCPTGALHYVLEGQEAEMPDEPTKITPTKDGPLMVSGNLVIETPKGAQKEVRAALCRCGGSSNKPYCDGTHARNGWSSEAEESSS